MRTSFYILSNLIFFAEYVTYENITVDYLWRMQYKLCIFCVQDGETLLHLALNNGHLKVFILLLGSLTDMDVNAQDKVVEWNVRSLVMSSSM